MPQSAPALAPAGPFLTARERFFLASIIAESGIILQKPERLVNSAWLGHIPFAFWLARVMQPRVVVELGTHHGASFCAFCQQVAKNETPGLCYAIDTWQGDDQAGFYDETVYENLAGFVAGKYPAHAHLVRSTFDDAQPLFDDASIDILHIDGYHTRDVMLHDFETWLPKVSTQGVVIMHDINARIPGYSGFEAWSELKHQYPHFSFEHSYGLGIIMPGKKTPPRLAELALLGEEAVRLVRSHFAKAGESVRNLRLTGVTHEKYMQEKDAWISELENDRSDKAARIDELSAQIDELSGKNAELAGENSRLSHRIDELQKAIEISYQAQQKKLEEISSLHRLIQGYEESNSWRVTAPLRKLRHIFKRQAGKR